MALPPPPPVMTKPKPLLFHIPERFRKPAVPAALATPPTEIVMPPPKAPRKNHHRRTALTEIVPGHPLTPGNKAYLLMYLKLADFIHAREPMKGEKKKALVFSPKKEHVKIRPDLMPLDEWQRIYSLLQAHHCDVPEENRHGEHRRARLTAQQLGTAALYSTPQKVEANPLLRYVRDVVIARLAERHAMRAGPAEEHEKKKKKPVQEEETVTMTRTRIMLDLTGDEDKPVVIERIIRSHKRQRFASMEEDEESGPTLHEDQPKAKRARKD